MLVKDRDTGREFELFESEELKEELRKHYDSKCDHKEARIGRIKYKNGSIHVRKVCTKCGEFVGDSLKKAAEHDSLPLFDQEEMRNAFYERRQKERDEIIQKHVRIQRRRDAGFQKKYATYLSSEKWKQKRDKVLARSNGLCEGCRERPAILVHHLTYTRIYRELLFDLVALCNSCHAICHPDKDDNPDYDALDDLPCYACRWHGETEEGNWCTKFDVHSAIALTDNGICGPAAREREELK